MVIFCNSQFDSLVIIFQRLFCVNLFKSFSVYFFPQNSRNNIEAHKSRNSTEKQFLAEHKLEQTYDFTKTLDKLKLQNIIISILINLFKNNLKQEFPLLMDDLC